MVVSVACHLSAGGRSNRPSGHGCDVLQVAFYFAAGLLAVRGRLSGHLTLVASADPLRIQPGSELAALDGGAGGRVPNLSRYRHDHYFLLAACWTGHAMDGCHHDGNLHSDSALYSVYRWLRLGAQKTDGAVAGGHHGLSLWTLELCGRDSRAGPALYSLDARH